MTDLTIISTDIIQANTNIGKLILTEVWRHCHKSPMDDWQLIIHPDDMFQAISTFRKYGVNIPVHIL